MCQRDRNPETAAPDSASETTTPSFPLHLYAKLTDAHCHIHDDRENIHKLIQTWSSGASNNNSDNTVEPLLTGKSCLMGVQPSKDLGLLEGAADSEETTRSLADETASLSLTTSSSSSTSSPIVTVTWNDTDTKGDWNLVSKLAQEYPDRFVPCFGIHPWFTHKYKALEGAAGSAFELRKVAGTKPKAGPGGASPLDPSTAEPSSHQHHPHFSHYQKVLSVPASAAENYLEELATRLPEPRELGLALKELRRQLEAHPDAIVGEIGLDKTARVPEPSIAASASSSSQNTNSNNESLKRTTLALTSIQHQLEVVREQLKLAASLNRPVSFHCVQAYGHWHDFLIQEGRKLREIEEDLTYRQQLKEIHATGGAVTISPLSPSGIRLRRKTAAKLRREARDVAWEIHVASTLDESSDEEEDDEDEDEDEEEESKTDLSTPVLSSTVPTIMPYEPVLPPRLCMHSYGGSIDMLKALVKLDHPPEIFFSFSIVINGRLQEQKLNELIAAVPEDRLLIESDHHSHSHVDGLLVEMAQRISRIRGWTDEETAEKTSRNWHRFVYG